MNKLFKRLVFSGIILTLLGGILFIVSFGAAGFKFSKLSGVKLIEKSDTFMTENLTIDLEDSDLILEFSESAENISVKYFDKLNRQGEALTKISVVKSGSSVKITEKSTYRAIFQLWDFQNTKVTLVIPSSLELKLDAETDNGDITVKGNANLKSGSFAIDNGDINTKNALIKSSSTLEFESDNGDIKLGKIDTVSLVIETENGDVSFTGNSSANNVTVSSDNGEIDIECYLKSENIAIETENGDIDAEDGIIDAETITIESDNADVSVKLADKKSDYSIWVNRNHGSSNIKNQEGGSRHITITTDNGDIEVYFAEK